MAWDWLPGRRSMPWHAVSIMDERREFIRLASAEGANRRELCRRVGGHPATGYKRVWRRFGVRPSTGYKWLGRWSADRELVDRSRRPHSSPKQTDRLVEECILAL